MDFRQSNSQRTATLPYELDDRNPFLAEAEAKLRQDIKEITALIDGAQRLKVRVEKDGARILDWFPSVLRHLLHARLVGPIPPAPKNSYFEEVLTDSDREQRSVLRVLVMLEILDWSESVLEKAEIRARTVSKRTLSETVRKRILQGEVIRILVSSEDLEEELQGELEELRERREQKAEAGLSSSPTEFPGLGAPTSYAHPLLDRGITPTNARHSTRPDLAWMQTSLASSVLTRSRQRAHSFPLALGLLARRIIMGTIAPSRMRTRAKSLGDTLHPDSSEAAS